jgi:hypothetical protein
MTDFPNTTNLRSARLGVSITAQGDEAMNIVTTAASRRERTARSLRDLVEIAGEDVAQALVDAVLAQLPACTDDFLRAWRRSNR